MIQENKLMPDKIPASLRLRRPSAVSQALRAIRADVDKGEAMWDMSAPGETTGFCIRVAASRDTRGRAYRLAQRVYHGCGYVPDRDALNVTAFDADSQTITLLVQDLNQRDAATITLVFDSTAGLPCDEIYGDELNSLRTQGRRLVEVTRLAICEEYQHSKLLLVRLFNFIYIFARHIKRFDDFVIEVNPRHVNYYRRLLCFEQFGPERPCPRVQDAPAVLLRLELSVAEEVRRAESKGAATNERTLYPYFYSSQEEGAAAEFLTQQHRPMSEADMRFFGLKSHRITLAEK